MVLIGGAELFTGNNLIVMAWARGGVSMARMLRNCVIIYSGTLSVHLDLPPPRWTGW
jgi:formate/nitrite transporter FocA (FNT family)